MQDEVWGYADAVLEALQGRAPAQAAEQLKEFSELLAGSADLRNALAQPTTSPPVRRAIVTDLLSRRAAGPVVALLSYAAEKGDGADYTEDVDALTYAATSRSAGMVIEDNGQLGRHAARARVSGYADAVLGEVSSERGLGDVEDELFRFMRIVEGNDQLRNALTTSELPMEARRALVDDLLGRRASAPTTRLARYVAQVGRPRDFVELLEVLVERVALETRRRVADVRSAVELSKEQRRRLGEALTRLTGVAVDVRVTVEPELLGGFVAIVGDTIVDASLRHRLAQAREALSSSTYLSGGGPQSN